MEQIIKQLDQGAPALILGYGVTGKALADFCDSRGWSYYIADDSVSSDRQAKYFLGQWPQVPQNATNRPTFFHDKNICSLFHSPGVSLSHPLVRQARKESIPVLSELDLASHFLKGKLIGVTGTNGKSTTVKLLQGLLCEAGLEASLKGNFGAPLITAVSEPPTLFHVVEESSFQLETINSLHHDYAICLNVTDDHFERHSDISEYTRAKAMIIRNAKPSDVFVYNQDDMWCVRMARESRARNLPFSLVQHLEEGGFLQGDHLVIKLAGREFRFDTDECALKGLHNFENMLAALLVALSIEQGEKAVLAYRRTLKTFESLPHRMQVFCVRDGITFIDDSKGTNVGAVVMALASLEKNVILIAGGVDKGGDYSPLRGILKGKVKKLILLGEASQKMNRALGDVVDSSVVSGMREAVAVAKDVARSGDTVLLSPACSSFDQYKNYHERGNDFQNRVQESF